MVVRKDKSGKIRYLLAMHCLTSGGTFHNMLDIIGAIPVQQRHQQREIYFREQARTTEKYVIPFIEQKKKISANLRVLEVGCGEGGNLLPFVQRGCEVWGIDIACHKIKIGRSLFADVPAEQVHLLCEDVYRWAPQFTDQFDIILLRDVIEHLSDPEKMLRFLKQILKHDGVIFIGFPPIYMPFGGHQQICENKVLSLFPYIHLLPNPIYRRLLQWGGEKEARIQELLEIKATGITIERLRRVIQNAGLAILVETIYLINPNYETKFGLKPRLQFPLIAKIPWVRNFVSTCGYYLLGRKNALG